MAKIDAMLMQVDAQDATAAREQMEQVANDIEELLDQVRQDQTRVVDNIEELVRLTKYTQSQSGGGGDQSQQQQQQQQEQERGRDPEVDQLKQQGQKPQQPEPQNQQTGAERPEDARPEDDPGRQEKGGERPPSETGEFQREDVSGRWGNLPPKVQESVPQRTFERFPEKYRRVIIEYYRRQQRAQDSR
jgi:hypothetical protein